MLRTKPYRVPLVCLIGAGKLWKDEIMGAAPCFCYRDTEEGSAGSGIDETAFYTRIAIERSDWIVGYIDGADHADDCEVIAALGLASMLYGKHTILINEAGYLLPFTRSILGVVIDTLPRAVEVFNSLDQVDKVTPPMWEGA